MPASRRERIGRPATLAAASVAAALAGLPTGSAFPAAGNHPAIRAAAIAVDWQTLTAVPSRLRNHCRFDRFGNYYCSNHCGADYQFYYCSQASFGCCRPRHGYCGGNGGLRCAP